MPADEHNHCNLSPQSFLSKRQKRGNIQTRHQNNHNARAQRPAISKSGREGLKAVDTNADELVENSIEQEFRQHGGNQTIYNWNKKKYHRYIITSSISNY